MTCSPDLAGGVALQTAAALGPGAGGKGFAAAAARLAYRVVAGSGRHASGRSMTNVAERSDILMWLPACAASCMHKGQILYF